MNLGTAMGIQVTNYANNANWDLLLNPFGGQIAIGTTIFTGTVNQPLQVTGGAYVSGNLGIGTTNPKGVLDLVSTTQPLYLPRMTEAQRDLIVGISSGAVIFNTSINEFQGYTGTAWVTF